MRKDILADITLQQMEALYRLVETGSFTRASERMHVTQPSLTKLIQNLENLVNARLVNRKNRGISLTREGQILYDYTKKVFRLRDDAGERLQRAQEQPTGPIYLCASSIPATYIIPRMLTHLRNAQPPIHIHVQSHDSDDAIRIILSDQAEIGIVGKHPAERKLYAEPVWKDRLVLAVRSDHPWTSLPCITVDKLIKEPFLIRERGSGTREVLESYLQRNLGTSLSHFQIVGELGSSEAIKEAIVAGAGVSILSSHAIRREREQGILTPVPVMDCDIERSFYLIYRKNFPLLSHHQRFLEIMKTAET